MSHTEKMMEYYNSGFRHLGHFAVSPYAKTYRFFTSSTKGDIEQVAAALVIAPAFCLLLSPVLLPATVVTGGISATFALALAGSLVITYPVARAIDCAKDTQEDGLAPTI